MVEDNTYELVNRYKGAGFTPFPLAKLSKVPPKGTCLDTIDKDAISMLIPMLDYFLAVRMDWLLWMQIISKHRKI